jgi:hypothetical protein
MPPSASCSTCHVERAAVSGTQMLMAEVDRQLLDTKPHLSRHCSPLSQDKTAVSNPALPMSTLASSALSLARTLARTGRPRPRCAQSSRLALSNRTKVQSQRPNSGVGTLSNSLFQRTTVLLSMSRDARKKLQLRCVRSDWSFEEQGEPPRSSSLDGKDRSWNDSRYLQRMEARAARFEDCFCPDFTIGDGTDGKQHVVRIKLRPDAIPVSRKPF